MRLAWVGGALLACAAVLGITGALSWHDATAVYVRVWPILLFAAAVTVVVELAADAGVFRALAGQLARPARGRTLLLWLLCAGLAVVSTAFLSLDTTASLFLPVSNLTNLLEMEQLGDPHPVGFLRAMALPATVRVAVTIGFGWLVFRRTLAARFSAPTSPAAKDRAPPPSAFLRCW